MAGSGSSAVFEQLDEWADGLGSVAELSGPVTQVVAGDEGVRVVRAEEPLSIFEQVGGQGIARSTSPAPPVKWARLAASCVDTDA